MCTKECRVAGVSRRSSRAYELSADGCLYTFLVFTSSILRYSGLCLKFRKLIAVTTKYLYILCGGYLRMECDNFLPVFQLGIGLPVPLMLSLTYDGLICWWIKLGPWELRPVPISLICSWRLGKLLIAYRIKYEAEPIYCWRDSSMCGFCVANWTHLLYFWHYVTS